MNSKKLVALLTIGAMAASMAACGSDSSSSTATTEAASTAATTAAASTAASADGNYKIAMIQQHQTNAFQISISEGAQAAADELGVDLTILSADQDAAKQISEIEQCVAEGYDAITFEPVDPAALGAAAKEAVDAGVLVINQVSACTDFESYGISAVCMGDNEKAGEVEMQAVADALDGKGNIAILTGPSGDAGGLQRLQGYNNILANYPDIVQVVEPADCQWDTASAQATVESWLSAYDLDAIVCENDGMAVGAGNAAGKDSGIIITGVDATPDGIEAILDGRITGTVSQDAEKQAANAIETCVKLLNGEKLEETTILTENIWVSADNAADFQ